MLRGEGDGEEHQQQLHDQVPSSAAAPMSLERLTDSSVEGEHFDPRNLRRRIPIDDHAVLALVESTARAWQSHLEPREASPFEGEEG
jgi:hypothetical protein